MNFDPIAMALRLAAVFEACGIRYLVGGSVASSLTGEPRSTLDLDMVVAIEAEDVSCLVDRLGAEFHADESSIQRAIRERSSVSLYHRPTAFKIDLFIMGGSPLDERQMARRVRVRTSSGRELYVYTAEDILLQKLRWFRLGRGISDRQWRDVLAIVAVQRGRLDLEYLRSAASSIDVLDLLERALAEAP